MYCHVTSWLYLFSSTSWFPSGWHLPWLCPSFFYQSIPIWLSHLASFCLAIGQFSFYYQPIRATHTAYGRIIPYHFNMLKSLYTHKMVYLNAIPQAFREKVSSVLGREFQNAKSVVHVPYEQQHAALFLFLKNSLSACSGYWGMRSEFSICVYKAALPRKQFWPYVLWRFLFRYISDYCFLMNSPCYKINFVNIS